MLHTRHHQNHKTFQTLTLQYPQSMSEVCTNGHTHIWWIFSTKIKHISLHACQMVRWRETNQSIDMYVSTSFPLQRCFDPHFLIPSFHSRSRVYYYILYLSRSRHSILLPFYDCIAVFLTSDSYLCELASFYIRLKRYLTLSVDRFVFELHSADHVRRRY